MKYEINGGGNQESCWYQVGPVRILWPKSGSFMYSETPYQLAELVQKALEKEKSLPVDPPASKFAVGDVASPKETGFDHGMPVRLKGQSRVMTVVSTNAKYCDIVRCIWHAEDGTLQHADLGVNVLEDAREKTAAAEPTKGPWTIKDNSQYFVMREKDDSLTNQDGTPYVWPKQAAYEAMVKALEEDATGHYMVGNYQRKRDALALVRQAENIDKKETGK